MGKHRAKLPKILLSLAAILIGAEIACQAIGAPVLPRTPQFIEAQEWRYVDWFEKDRALLWRLRPSRVIDGDFLKPGRYSINARGFRGPDFQLEKPAGITRVVCLGEANTFGLGVSDDDAWPRQMEKRLNALDPQKRRWEVLNLALPDYSTMQGVRLARELFPKLKPDFVLSCFSWADHQPAADGIPDDRIDLGPEWKLNLDRLLCRSALVRWIRAGWAAIIPPRTPQRAAPGFDQRRVPSTDFSENIEKLTREGQLVGARAITVTSPIAWPPPGQTDTSGIFHVHHRYRRLARFGAIAGGGEFVEMANVFDEFPPFFDDRSVEIALFNAQGHAFAGVFLARYLLGDSTVVARYGSAVFTSGR